MFSPPTFHVISREIDYIWDSVWDSVQHITVLNRNKLSVARCSLRCLLRIVLQLLIRNYLDSNYVEESRSDYLFVKQFFTKEYTNIIKQRDFQTLFLFKGFQSFKFRQDPDPN